MLLWKLWIYPLLDGRETYKAKYEGKEVQNSYNQVYSHTSMPKHTTPNEYTSDFSDAGSFRSTYMKTMFIIERIPVTALRH